MHVTSDNLPKEKAVLIGIHIKGEKREPVAESLEELKSLAETAEAEVIKTFMVSRDYISSKFVLGKGKGHELVEFIRKEKANIVIFDMQLSPIQVKNLRDLFQIKVIDKVELILDIFTKRAQTHEAQIQIELAQLHYTLPRLTRMWQHLSRQAGGIGVTGPGAKGPGEKQIEIDRRRIKEKIQLHKSRLEEIKKSRALQRQQRVKTNILHFSIVGYTNAGKSSLLNRLTNAEAFVKDQLFSTLDPLSRKLDLDNGTSIILTDTVGFINNLPLFLIESFKATLEEVIDADYLIHVVDGANPDFEKKISAVNKVLFEDLKIHGKEIITVINKIDKITDEQKNIISNKIQNGIFISAKNGDGIEDLLKEIIKKIKCDHNKYLLFFPMADLGKKQILYQKSRILKEEYNETGVNIEVELNSELYGIMKQFVVKALN
ncbi:MAG: GTP-binding protein protease modulator [uncultured bacterium]|nr:MAG: GTP-binding protein protease modulator [uncultured bacterium]